MIDLLIYVFLTLGIVWVGWDDRNQPFDYAHGERIPQEGTESGAHN